MSIHPLWAGDWRPAQPPPTATHEPPPDPLAAGGPPPSAPRPRRLRTVLVAGGATTVLAVSAFLAGDLLSENERAAAPSAALPAAAASSPRASGTVADVYKKAGPAVVSIRAGSGQGTGFLLGDSTTVVTNAHVVGSSSTVQVRFGEDGTPAQGRVLGSDPSSDLAVVRIPESASRGVTPLQLADDRSLTVGDQLVAIGNPFGLDRTATAGIVSALGRSIEAPNGFSIADAIQTDAPINPGNSGGPLLDANGRVVGVNSQIATAGAGGGNVGVGFAVPATLVQQVVPVLERGGAVARPYLGLSTGDAPGGGALVGSATGPAASAGVRAGDVIVEAGGQAVDGPDDVSAALADREPGETITLTVRRGGDRVEVEVTLGTRPTEAP
jgi:putative serine protease PepD